MKIILSPAKSLDYESALPTSQYTQPHFIEDAEKLNGALARKSKKAISELMHISDKLAELNKQRAQQFNTPFTPQNARPAVYAFNGDVYQGLDVYTLPEEKIDALQNTVRILSGMYGVLKPLDLMQPYRLEMGTKMKVGRAENLYQYWGTKITDTLNQELAEGELLVNLASNEYNKVVQLKNIKSPVVTPVFKDFKNGKLKIISFFAKKARGLMTRYALDTNAQTIEDLQGFDYEDYHYSEQHSDEAKGELVFIR